MNKLKSRTFWTPIIAAIVTVILRQLGVPDDIIKFVLGLFGLGQLKFAVEDVSRNIANGKKTEKPGGAL